MGESGKSTVFKQMVMNYGTGFTDDEQNSLVSIAAQNIVQLMAIILQHAEDITAHDPEAKLSEDNSAFAELIKCILEDRQKILYQTTCWKLLNASGLILDFKI
jgi:hypothetical protein